MNYVCNYVQFCSRLYLPDSLPLPCLQSQIQKPKHNLQKVLFLLLLFLHLFHAVEQVSRDLLPLFGDQKHVSPGSNAASSLALFVPMNFQPGCIQPAGRPPRNHNHDEPLNLHGFPEKCLPEPGVEVLRLHHRCSDGGGSSNVHGVEPDRQPLERAHGYRHRRWEFLLAKYLQKTYCIV